MTSGELPNNLRKRIQCIVDLTLILVSQLLTCGTLSVGCGHPYVFLSEYNNGIQYRQIEKTCATVRYLCTETFLLVSGFFFSRVQRQQK